MTHRKGLDICLLGFLILSAGCVPISKTTLSPGSPEDLPGCYAIFPAEPWESVHKIEATIQRRRLFLAARGHQGRTIGAQASEPLAYTRGIHPVRCRTPGW